MSRSDPSRRWPLKLLLALGAAGLALLLGDLSVAARGLDRARIARSLYFQNAYVPVHEVSDDPWLHYELKAGASFESQGRYGPYRIHINQHRARGEERALEKGPEVFRILCFGPSTTFGADVSDAETIPAQLEAWLAEQAEALPPGAAPRFEVWNFGTSAYVPSQTGWLAMKKLGPLQPDLVLMVFNNAGRRAFLNVPAAEDQDYLPWFRQDPSLWDENFPPPAGRAPWLHRRLLSGSAFYRYVIAQQVLDRLVEVGPRQGEEQNRRVSSLLVQRAQEAGVALGVVSWGAENEALYPGVPPSRQVGIFEQVPAGQETHPPAPALRQIARRIGSTLASRGVIPGIDPAAVQVTVVDPALVARQDPPTPP